MTIQELRIGQQVDIDTRFCKGVATVVGLSVSGLVSPILAKERDQVNNFLKNGKATVTVITPDGYAFSGIDPKDCRAEVC